MSNAEKDVFAESERNIDRALAIESFISQIEENGVVTPELLVSLESIAPGALLDDYPPGGYHGKNVTIAIESLAKYKGILIAAALLAMFRYIWKLINGGSDHGDSGGGSGGGGSGGRDDFEQRVERMDSTRQSVETAMSETERLAQSMKDEDALKEIESAKNLLRGLGMAQDKIDDVLSSAAKAKKFFFGGEFLDEVFIYAAQDCNAKLVTDADFKQKQEKLTKVFVEMSMFVKDRMSYVMRCLNRVKDQRHATLTQLKDEIRQGMVSVSANFVFPPLPEDDTEDLKAIRYYLGGNSHALQPRELVKEFYDRVDELMDGIDYPDFLRIVKDPAGLKERLYGIIRLNVAIDHYKEEFRKVFAETYNEADRLVRQLQDDSRSLEPEYAMAQRVLRSLEVDLHRITMYTSRMAFTADSLRVFCDKAYKATGSVLDTDEQIKKFFETIGERYSKMYPK